MNRRLFLASAVCATILPSVLLAGTIEDTIVSELSAQGYSHIQIGKTWLGRLRFVATSSTRRREIIVNARTGEILRDYWEDLATGSTQAPRIVDPDDSGSGTPGSKPDDSRNDDDPNDDDSNDDHSDDRRDDKDEKDEDDEEDEKDDDEEDDD